MLVHRNVAADPATADVMVKLSTSRLLAAVIGDPSLPGLEISGDRAALQAFLGVLERTDSAFNIVTP